jgi:ABC-type phosphate transport system permease subunit
MVMIWTSSGAATVNLVAIMIAIPMTAGAAVFMAFFCLPSRVNLNKWMIAAFYC